MNRAPISTMAAALLLGGCSAYPTLKQAPPIDCDATSAYDTLMIDTFEMVGNANLWNQGDNLCVDGGVMQNVVALAAGDGPCGSTAALVIDARHCNDWGSLFGFNSFGMRDASAYEGVTLWARAPQGSNNVFTIALDDANTAVAGNHCKEYTTDAGVQGQPGTTTDSNGNVISTGTPGIQPAPDQCGNSYSAFVTVTTEWRLYTVPFQQFTQDPKPNRVPNQLLTQVGPYPNTGILPSALYDMVVRLPKETPMELWLDNLGFYRRKTADAGAVTDAGADARAASDGADR